MLIIVPNYVSPFKINETNEVESQPNISFAKNNRRLNEIELNINTIEITYRKRIVISNYEIEKAGVSYTIDTIRHYQNEIQELLQNYSNRSFEIYFLIGDDNLNNFDKWRNWDEILVISHLVVARRNYEHFQILDIINSKYDNYSSKIQILSNPYYYISSTEIRNQT